MSISAAASPNMGMITIRSLVFLMTILNIRLGYWLPNPDDCPTVPKDADPPRMKPGVRYLLKEMAGRLDAAHSYVNLTDGGHIENLGVYELLRRPSKLIIAYDAEADPDYEFPSLARVIRFARIDWGIDIDIDVTDLRKGPDGQSLKSWAVGRIQYSENDVGYLLYIKVSLLGNENRYVKTYARKNPSFPHESTGDQFFSEAQFEAYRALGHKIASGLCELVDPIPFVAEHGRLHEWVERLEAPLRPRGSLETELVGIQDELNAMEYEFNDPDVSAYAQQVFPELDLPDADGADEQKIFWLCVRQLNFMENVFVQAQLDKSHQRNHYFNRGWMNMFRRWAASPFFVDAWTVAIGNYSVSFERFCSDSLGLETAWK
jgi:hypothetical protein